MNRNRLTDTLIFLFLLLWCSVVIVWAVHIVSAALTCLNPYFERRELPLLDICLGGPGVGMPMNLCEAFDTDGDGDCDLRDFAEIQRTVTDPNPVTFPAQELYAILGHGRHLVCSSRPDAYYTPDQGDRIGCRTLLPDELYEWRLSAANPPKGDWNKDGFLGLYDWAMFAALMRGPDRIVTWTCTTRL